MKNKFGGKNYILCIEQSDASQWENDIITRSARAYSMKYGIPLQRRFTTRKGAMNRLCDWDCTWDKLPDFQYLGPNAFRTCDMCDKLIIVAHGTPSAVGNFSARDLSGYLSMSGLQRMGLITFKACNVGKDRFLYEFLKKLAQNQVYVGWAKGYMGAAETVWVPGKDPELGGLKPTEEVTVLQRASDGDGDEIEVLEGHNRYKIVRGLKNNWGDRQFGRYGYNGSGRRP
jgi:hypothetical protein